VERKRRRNVTDWWSLKTQGSEGESTLTPDPASSNEAFMEEASPLDVEAAPEAGSTSRSKVRKVAGGVAGAVIVGTFAIHGVAGGSTGASAVTSAGAKGAEEVRGVEASGNALPPAGGGPAEAQQNQPSAASARKAVTLTAASSGVGRIGAIVTLSIHNGTDRPLTVLASLVKGDSRPAVVGEGTLAPGSRIVQPGDTVEGTVEFSSEGAPHQVVLTDLKGTLIARSVKASE
jgi:hypothetical protein